MHTQHLTPLAAATDPLLDVLRRRVGGHVDLHGWTLAKRDPDWRNCVDEAAVVGVPTGLVTVWPSCAGEGRWSVEALLDDGSLWCRYGVWASQLAGTVDEAVGVVIETAGVAV